MVNPQPTDAHLRIAHSIEEEIMMRDFTKRQRSILDLILRLSWGCGKKTAIIPKQRDFEIVGISESKIKSELEWLENAKVIFWSRNTNEYSFNKNYDEWRISIVLGYNKERLTELININLRTSQNGNILDEKAINFPSRGKVLVPSILTDSSATGPPKESIKEITTASVDYTVAELPKTASSETDRLPGASVDDNESGRLPRAPDEPQSVEIVANYYTEKTGRLANSNDFIAITEVLDRPIAVPTDYKSRIKIIKQVIDRIVDIRALKGKSPIKSFSYFKDGIFEEYRKHELLLQKRGDTGAGSSPEQQPPAERSNGSTREYGNGVIDYSLGFSE